MAGNFPAFSFAEFLMRGKAVQNELSIFIDESGDFGVYESHAPLYIVSMVLHEQAKDISKNITVLNEHIHNLGYREHAIHVGPLIRRESMYKDDLTEDRKRLFCNLRQNIFHIHTAFAVFFIRFRIGPCHSARRKVYYIHTQRE